jgi:hypothetical protein
VDEEIDFGVGRVGQGRNLVWGEVRPYHSFLYPPVPNLNQPTLRHLGLSGPPAALVAFSCTTMMLKSLSCEYYQY